MEKNKLQLCDTNNVSHMSDNSLASPQKFTSHILRSKLTSQDRDLLKVFLWYDLYIHLSKEFNINYKDEDMFNPKIIRLLLVDLIKDGEYTLEGIGYATRIPFDVLQDIIYEINTNPSTSASAKLIEYYIISKRQEHTEFIRKIFQWAEYGDVFGPYFNLSEPSGLIKRAVTGGSSEQI